MTPKLILSSEGTLKYVAEWPEEPPLIGYTKGAAIKVNQDYKQQCEQAIANAIPFKFEKEEDEKALITIIFCQSGELVQRLKPYDVPKGLEIEIKEDWGPFHEYTSPDKFAFIKPRPKEESQEELWDEVAFLHDLGYFDTVKAKFRIERIK